MTKTEIYSAIADAKTAFGKRLKRNGYMLVFTSDKRRHGVKDKIAIVVRFHIAVGALLNPKKNIA